MSGCICVGCQDPCGDRRHNKCIEVTRVQGSVIRGYKVCEEAFTAKLGRGRRGSRDLDLQESREDKSEALGHNIQPFIYVWWYTG